MQSQYYEASVRAGQQYQQTNKVWSGNDAKKYAHLIADLVQHYQARSMLDYGCGKGFQYQTAVEWPTDMPEVYTHPMTFDQRISVESVYLYDPCVIGLDSPPQPDEDFDCVICTQVLGSIPDDDLYWVIDDLMTWTRKFCFIGLIDPKVHVVKSNKTSIYDPQAFKAVRTRSWYRDIVRKWEGSDLYLYFKGSEPNSKDWFVGNAIRRDKE